ncbi:MAG TPA: SUMF1/EgtB/PvdO family nonheme iron enzyme [Pirellulales bacterium]|nr:SUMF1/EgtB/PvdO family nonheme iron enzyme [Pirellulales bacterium]
MKELSQTVGEFQPERAPFAPDESTPKNIGRYRVERILGRGGFGLVYLAHDERLQRLVAIKVPHPQLVAKPEAAEAYLIEARTVANLDHPNIVPVHDVGSSEDYACFVVSKFIDGTDLATRLAQSRLNLHETVELVATVAEALHHAHKQGLVHRDVKPSNILLDKSGKPFVADFGLALREQDVGKGSRYAGTPAYMSPEQACGEGHRVDGRSDIFSLGVVFYELLVGRRPFKGKSQDELLDQVAGVEARPPRQIHDDIPKELDRICLKALSKRASERYSAARDMADDLRHWIRSFDGNGDLARPATEAPARMATHLPPVPRGEAESTTPSTPATSATTRSADSQPIKIVPKGLRSFDAHDADFFLELLPGPRDRDGLPDSLRFWKTRIEETDADNVFSVGLLYGPSGCGKSSLVKAGLLPRLPADVIAVYVEATADETERRLLNGLRKRCSFWRDNLDLPENLGLKETLSALRRGQGMPAGKKVLIVLDQFEQWLHARKEEQNTELVQALRQCDGGRVQCLVMVRDDFWMAATRFMRELEIRLLEGQNSAAVDLFDKDHSRKVLAAFGQAFGKLPEQPGKKSKEEREFLNLAVLGLAEEGKVVSVRLALFAEMMKGKAWTPASLKAVGGTQGVGVTFLEETFSAATAPPEHRYHQKAARSVLAALLPESGAVIKGHMRSHAELLETSGYRSRAKDFDDLIHILDREIRLITPTDPEGKVEADGSERLAQPGEKYYQLSHDYLVAPLRDWLTRKQKETRRGRAELLLADRAGVWNARRENRQLPSLLQWVQIRCVTAKKNWTPPQRKMMVKAGTFHALRGTTSAMFLLLVCFGYFSFAKSMAEREQANRATFLVNRLLEANTAQTPEIIREITPQLRRWTDPTLRSNLKLGGARELHSSLALLPIDPSQVEYLFQRLLKADAADVPVIVSFLKPHGSQLDQAIRDILEHGSLSERIRAAVALAEFNSRHEQWQRARDDVVTALVSVPPAESGEWIKMLRPVGSLLADPLKQRFHDRSVARDAERPIAAAALAEYLKEDPQSLTELMLLADHEQEFQPLLEAVRSHQQTVAPGLRTMLHQSPKADDHPAVRASFWKIQANAAVCLLELGEDEAVWPLFLHSPDPSLRSYVIDRIARLGRNHEALAARIKQEPDAASRYALILALGRFDLGKLSRQQRQAYMDQLSACYRDDPDSGVHAAAEWALRNWQPEQGASLSDGEPAGTSPPKSREWFVNSQGQTFAVINGPVEFLMGDTVGDKPVTTDPTSVTLSHRFALATHEVTVEQFQRFRSAQIVNASLAPKPDCPMTVLSWYDAAAYCNWLSEREGIPADQRCYEPNEQHEYAAGMKIAADYLRRTGYRLPTEAEWEFACRANTTSGFGFGEPEELVKNYAWYMANSESRLWPVGMKMPNSLGMFDMHGSAWEWCQSVWNTAPNGPSDVTVQDSDRRVLRGGSFNLLAATLRSSLHFNIAPSSHHYDYGFRPVRTLPPRADASSHSN